MKSDIWGRMRTIKSTGLLHSMLGIPFSLSDLVGCLFSVFYHMNPLFIVLPQIQLAEKFTHSHPPSSFLKLQILDSSSHVSVPPIIDISGGDDKDPQKVRS